MLVLFSHADLSRHASPSRLVDEISGSKRNLECILDRDIHFFAFPYGQPHNMSAAAFGAARNAGYRGVCSAHGSCNFPGQKAFHLRRIHADPETDFFRNWLTINPRKQRIVQRRERGLAWLTAAGADRLGSAKTRRGANGS